MHFTLGLKQLYHLEWVFSFWKGTNRYLSYIHISLEMPRTKSCLFMPMYHASSPLLLARAWSRVNCTKYFWKVLIRIYRYTFSDNRLLPQTFFKKIIYTVTLHQNFVFVAHCISKFKVVRNGSEVSKYNWKLNYF